MSAKKFKISAIGTVSVAAAMLAATTFGPADARSSAGTQGAKPVANSGVHLIPLPSARHFQRHVTNRYFPLKPGSEWVYKGYDDAAGERIVVRVLKRTKPILGIRATVVSDRAFLNGELIEKTRDWYAQDDRGRVWYLGEATESYDDGNVSTAGSWEAGVNGAKPGVVMFKRGKLNHTYYQEYYAAEAEDQGNLLDRSARVVGPTGEYRHVRMTKDTTPLEPEMLELKFYARGVGMILELATSPDIGRVELVKFSRG